MAAVLEISRDKSWRVRWSLAHKVYEVMECNNGSTKSSSSSDAFQSSLSTVFNSLLNDPEAEVGGRFICCCGNALLISSIMMIYCILLSYRCTGKGSSCVSSRSGVQAHEEKCSS